MISKFDNTNFGAIYCNPKAKFSPKQYSVKLDTVSKLRRPYKNNLTYEEYFQKKNRSFYIDNNDKDESITLYMLSNGVLAKDEFDNVNNLCIGTYDMEHLLNVNHISTIATIGLGLNLCFNIVKKVLKLLQLRR